MSHSITFLLPGVATYPIGGYKVVYEYANRLSEDGNKVNIVYGVASRPIKNPIIRFTYKFVRSFRYLKYYLFYQWKPISWFKLNDSINQYLKYDLRHSGIPKSDYYIATAWSTAPWVNSYKDVDADHKIYLIQSFEDWATEKSEVEATWKLPLRKIVIAPWLLKIAESLNEHAELIENGFDQNYFHLSNPIEDRNNLNISMLYHRAPLKGCADGIAALEIVRKKYANLNVTFFGADLRPDSLPKWINYIHNPNRKDHNALYNNSAIFVAPSHIEGFALTPPEAMLCGSCVCATDIGGYTIVCHDKQTALLSEVGDTQAMANNIITLIENKELRIKLATTALHNIKQYTWEVAYLKLKTILDS